MAAARRREQLVVAGDALGRRVQPVGEQREAQVAFGVAEVVDLQAAHLRLDVRLVGQERRDHDERPELGRHTAVQLQPRKRPWGRARWSPSQLTSATATSEAGTRARTARTSRRRPGRAAATDSRSGRRGQGGDERQRAEIADRGRRR